MRNYGDDSAAGQYLWNHEGAGDYEGMQFHADVEALGVLAEDDFWRGKKGEFREPLNNIGAKCKIANRNTVFKKMKAIVEKKGGEKNFEGKQSRLAEVGGISSKGDFEQRRSAWSRSGNKAACFEFGNTDRFKAQFPIWIQKKKKWANGNPTINTKGGAGSSGGKRRKIWRRIGKVCLSGNE